MKALAEAVNIPIVASGGAGSLTDIGDVFEYGGADAALVASLLHYGDHSVADIKRYLRARNIAVRSGETRIRGID